MTKAQLKLLEELVLLPSPSGFEKEIAKRIMEAMPKRGCSVEVDFQNNVSVVIPGRTRDTVMIDAHHDQIGFIVSNIDDNGHISLLPIGGADSSIMSGKNLLILSDSGPVNAVVNRKAAHQITDESDEFIEYAHEAVVDIGVRSRTKALKVVQIGDPVVYRPIFEPLQDGYYTGSGLDDKTGCFVLIEVIRAILRSKKKPMSTLVFTFSSQEETGGRKCRPLIKRFEPQTFIEVDVTFASDWNERGWEAEAQAGRCVLGKGPVFYRGVDINAVLFNQLRTEARKCKIPFQVQASTGEVGYTATELTHESYGIHGMIVGLPLRNMHSPVEIVHVKDLTDSIKLLSQCLLNRQMGRI